MKCLFIKTQHLIQCTYLFNISYPGVFNPINSTTKHDKCIWLKASDNNKVIQHNRQIKCRIQKGSVIQMISVCVKINYINEKL